MRLECNNFIVTTTSFFLLVQQSKPVVIKTSVLEIQYKITCTDPR